MPTLDDCISNIYEPGFIPADPGIPPSTPTLTDASLDFEKANNSMYVFLLIAW